jgi:hypothetical protein
MSDTVTIPADEARRMAITGLPTAGFGVYLLTSDVLALLDGAES